MFDTVFTFRGRLNRLKFFASSLGLTMAVLALALLVGVTFGFSGGLKAPLALLPLALIGLLGFGLWFWISLSLQVRRIRDIGLNPLVVIPLMIVVSTVYQVVTAGFQVATAAVAVPSHPTIVGSLLNLAYGAFLLLWPGKSDDAAGFTARLERAPAESESSTLPPRVAAAMATAAAAPRQASQAIAAPTFGRRVV